MLRVYKVSTKAGRGPGLRGYSALGSRGNKLYSTICIAFLSECFPTMCGYNKILMEFFFFRYLCHLESH